MKASSAVDEGRDPYGLPGRGNLDQVWQRVNVLPCPECGATRKRLSFDKRNATIVCGETTPN